MQRPSIITIDGPAASGKSTLGKRLADHLGYLFFDTGVMYRAVTLAGLKRGLDVDHDEAALTALAEVIQIDIQPPSVKDKRACDVLLDGADITWEIRTREVDDHVSPVSVYRGVRLAMAAQQRRIGLRGKVVMVGRDIGTVVLPEADLKIYLDASAEERARRRYLENLQRGEVEDYEVILAGIRRRDEIDSQRAFSPLKAAEDAVVIDSDHMDAEQVFIMVKALCK